MPRPVKQSRTEIMERIAYATMKAAKAAQENDAKPAPAAPPIPSESTRTS